MKGEVMRVEKRQVVEFVVGDLVLKQEEAEELLVGLAAALGRPVGTYLGCNGRMSHGPHWWGSEGQYRCTGLRFDRT